MAKCANYTVFYNPTVDEFSVRTIAYNTALEKEFKANENLYPHLKAICDEIETWTSEELVANRRAAQLEEEKRDLEQEKRELTSRKKDLEAKNKELEEKARKKDKEIIKMISAGQAEASLELINLYPEIVIGGSIDQGDVMRYHGHLYLAKQDIAGVTAADLPDGEHGNECWEVGALPEKPIEKKYKKGDKIPYQGVIYVCLEDTDQGPEEAVYPAWDLANNHPEL